MTWRDTLALAMQSLGAHLLRTALILLAMSIGVIAVVLLTTLGETGRRYITDEFQSLGTNLLIMLPGRNETTGGAPPMLGATPRDLTLGDMLALERSPYLDKVTPVLVGGAPVSTSDGLERETTILGTTAAMQRVRNLTLAQGTFLPVLDPYRAAPVAVIGETIRAELFPRRGAVGEWLQVGDRRFRILGVLADEGVSVGVNFNDVVLVPVASAQQLFNREGLFRVMAEMPAAVDPQRAIADARRIIMLRHEGEDDVTLITQDSLVSTFDRILGAVTYGIAGIGAISLLVAGILIMNVMLVSVAQRTAEVGLLKALGGSAGIIRRLFLTEALLLSGLGAALGLAIGVLLAMTLGYLWPRVPFTMPAWALVAAPTVALVTGLLFGVMPARRAARLDPVVALAKR
ncbi:MAG: ABC transporter permease [Gammaproteobacteria bacterium]|nr:ABC transporter permease [Gammaproteobacteria bacterium]